MAAWAKANNVPGLTWGVVKRGEAMVHGGFAGTGLRPAFHDRAVNHGLGEMLMTAIR